MFIIVKKIDHDTWSVTHNIHDKDHRSRDIVHSYQDVSNLVIHFASLFEYYTVERNNLTSGNLYVSFDNPWDFDETVWRLADYLQPCLFRTNHFAAAYKL